MAYEVEWKAGADFSQVLASLDKVEKTLGSMERAANRSFDRVAEKATFMSRQLDKMVSLKFFSQALGSSRSFIASALEEAAEGSAKVRADLDRIEKSWSNLKGGIGMDLMTQTTGGGSATQVEGWLDGAEKVRSWSVDALANVFTVWATIGRGLVGDTAGAGQNVEDLKRGGAFEVRRQQALDREIEKRQKIIELMSRASQTDERAAKRVTMDEDARARFDAVNRFNDAKQAAMNQLGRVGVEVVNRRIDAAKQLLDVEIQRLDVARAMAVQDSMTAAWEGQQALNREREEKAAARARGLDALGRDVLSGNIGTLRDLGMDRESQRLEMRLREADALDALRLRTDITDDDKALKRSEIENMWQWKRDALELGFMAEDAMAQRTVSARGFAGGLAGANAGVTQAALAGSDPATRAAQQTASQTREANRLLGVVIDQLKKREAAVYR